MDLKNIVKNRLDDYLEFNSDELFEADMIRVFGGAIRDSICNDPINDIDILCGASSCKHLSKQLEKKGYIHFDDLIHKGLNSLYSGIHVISEPHTWIKGTKIIQLIRPSIKSNQQINSYSDLEKQRGLYKKGFIDLIQNVDMSCCGVSYNGKEIFENYKDSIIHCNHKKFFVNKNALMYNSRFFERENKLIDRGWIKLLNEEDIRDVRIEELTSPIKNDFFRKELPLDISKSFQV